MTIPESVTNIGESAFNGCSGLTSMVIPASVTNIGNKAFALCYGIDTVYFLSEDPTNYDNTLFNECNSQLVIQVPVGSYEKYKSPIINGEMDKIAHSTSFDEVYVSYKNIIEIIENKDKIEQLFNDYLGYLSDEQSGPAVRVTKDGKTVILYNPDNVEFIKIAK